MNQLAYRPVEEVIDTQGDIHYRFARKLTGNHHDAEDTVQESYLIAITKIRDISRFHAFVMHTIFNVVMNQRRQRKSRRRGPVAESAMSERPFLETLPTYDTPIERNEISDEVNAALESLPNTHREAYLDSVRGYPQTETAARQGVALGTVKSRVHDTKRRLRSMLYNR